MLFLWKLYKIISLIRHGLSLSAFVGAMSICYTLIERGLNISLFGLSNRVSCLLLILLFIFILCLPKIFSYVFDLANKSKLIIKLPPLAYKVYLFYKNHFKYKLYCFYK